MKRGAKLQDLLCLHGFLKNCEDFSSKKFLLVLERNLILHSSMFIFWLQKSDNRNRLIIEDSSKAVQLATYFNMKSMISQL